MPRGFFGRRWAQQRPEVPLDEARKRLPLYLQRDPDYHFEAEDGGHVVMAGFLPYYDAEFTKLVGEDDEGVTPEGLFYCRIAGGTFHQADLQRPNFGPESLVLIAPEPSNPADPHALLVRSFKPSTYKAGHLPRGVAAALTPLLAAHGCGMGVVLQTVAKDGIRTGLRIVGSVGQAIVVETPTSSIRLWG